MVSKKKVKRRENKKRFTNFYKNLIFKMEVNNTKFIISNLSLAMFDNKEFNLNVREITEKEFKALSYNAYSHIGHSDIAEMCQLEYNREPVHVRIGDQLFLVQLYRGVLKFYEINVKKE